VCSLDRIKLAMAYLRLCAAPRSQRKLDVEGEDPGVGMRRCRAGADVILDAWAKYQ
jgi:hypothetical protein